MLENSLYNSHITLPLANNLFMLCYNHITLSEIPLVCFATEQVLLSLIKL